ncbi:MAG: ABC transporter permease [Chloroflexi bacterium OLB14]|nr:MAG: ABC transporter permease [Chloroflexi bacterium OLB14]
MKKIFAIAWKDAIIRFSSFSEILFFIILPIVFIFLFAGAVPTGDEDNRIRLLVVDQANTSISQEILSELEKSTSVRPDVMSIEEAQEQFDSNRVAAMLIIPAGFDIESIQSGNAQLDFHQQPSDIDANVAQRAVETALRKVSSVFNAAQMALEEAKARGTFESLEDEQAYFNAALETAKTLQADSPERIKTVQGNTPDDFDYDPQANVSAGQLITWVFIPLFGISALFAYERQQGTLRRILTTPTSKATFLFGTISGQVLMALIQMTLIVLFAFLAFKLNWGNPIGLYIVLSCSCLAAAAIGTAMGTFIKSEGQAVGLSIMAGMLMGMLGGCWFPIELFPPFMQSFAKIFPTTWAMQGLLDLLLRGAGVVDILPEAGMLIGFAVIFFGIGVMKFRYE